jgi:NAD(P)-dependent dehydrogenase (short-subunit alcohol dehydrogenase family)
MSKRQSSAVKPKNAVVVGGARGIGGAIVRRLVADGFSVTIADMLDAEAKALARELDAQFIRTDITDSKSVAALASAVKERVGDAGIQAAVNSVGVFNVRQGLMDTSRETFEKLLQVNLIGAFVFTHAMVPLMTQDASLVHIGSVNGKTAGTDLGAYKVTKAGLHMMSRCLALELAKDPRKIRVNVVAPGWVDTPGERLVMKAEGRAAILDDPESAKIIPLGRRTEAREIADAVGFVVSKQGSGITGQILYVDCGITT